MVYKSLNKMKKQIITVTGPGDSGNLDELKEVKNKKGFVGVPHPKRWISYPQQQSIA